MMVLRFPFAFEQHIHISIRCLICALSSAFLFGCGATKAEGFYFTARKGGATIILVPTYHRSPQDFALPKPIKESIKEASVLAVEKDLSDPSVAKIAHFCMAKMERNTPKLSISPESRRRISDIAARTQASIVGLDDRSLNNAIGGLAAVQWRDWKVEYGLDMKMITLAKTASVVVLPLEPFCASSDAFTSLAPTAITTEYVDEAVAELHAELGPGTGLRLIHAWKNGNYEEAESIFKESNHRRPLQSAMEAEIIRIRDTNMAKELERLALERITVVAAIGLHHFLTPGGIDDILAEKGWVISEGVHSK